MSTWFSGQPFAPTTLILNPGESSVLGSLRGFTFKLGRPDPIRVTICAASPGGGFRLHQACVVQFTLSGV